MHRMSPLSWMSHRLPRSRMNHLLPRSGTMTKAAMSWVSSRPPWQNRRRPSQKRLHQTAKKRKPPRQKKGKPHERNDMQLLRLPNDLQLLRLPSDRQLHAASSISRVGLQTILTKTRQQRNRYEGTSCRGFTTEHSTLPNELVCPIMMQPTCGLGSRRELRPYMIRCTNAAESAPGCISPIRCEGISECGT